MPDTSPRVLQVLGSSTGGVARHVADLADILGRAGITVDPVSYTHLTLPTIYSV